MTTLEPSPTPASTAYDLYYLQNGKRFFWRNPNHGVTLIDDRRDSAILWQPEKGEGLHHIAFDVADIYAEMKRLQGEGFTLLNETPKQGADNKLVCFLHPKGTNGVLIELCQERP